MTYSLFKDSYNISQFDSIYKRKNINTLNYIMFFIGTARAITKTT
ncbi:hypothetical protein PAUR_b1016 [Pseudoalteromonas aurantia 208]|uniref:Uncharacterized protein n=1 Tax=Pseudoalteromonas aurantia 208 TaxID=1314867 RepID=A0ABR9EMH4_9GAMM|nr:hypothetical protein [Pseudoalteromonas aurantia 208]